MEYFPHGQPFLTFLFFTFVRSISNLYMKIIVDDKIPYIKEAIESIADEAVYLAGRNFTPETVKDADALIIRTRTHCNSELLAGSRVRLIATATIGYDHIDTEFCRQAGIEWRNAPGCNAASVAQYVQSGLIVWSRMKKRDLKGLTIGIVGVGNVGRKVAEVAKRFGMRMLLNDPPREATEGSRSFCSLEQIAEECDIVSFHVPLYIKGAYKTFHLADEKFFRSLRQTPLLINTSRGEVIETDALSKALDKHLISDAIIDVWENEPAIDRELLGKVLLGTPHIAGYSADGKANATRMALDAVCNFFAIKKEYVIAPPPPASPTVEARTYEEALLRIYDPRNDSNRLKAQPEVFEKLREEYPLRREEAAYNISCRQN